MSTEEVRFRHWIVNYIKSDPQHLDVHDLTDLTFGYALVDLNGDRRNEAIVWIRDQAYCGSGGCWLEVFRATRSGWRSFADAGIAHPPIKVLPTRTHGWRDLSERQYGGGTYRPFELWLRFNGRNYDSKGSKVPRGIHGRIIIKDAKIPLFPSECRRAEEAGSVFGPMSIPTGKPGSSRLLMSAMGRKQCYPPTHFATSSATRFAARLSAAGTVAAVPSAGALAVKRRVSTRLPPSVDSVPS
jgi:hypothetical protein